MGGLCQASAGCTAVRRLSFLGRLALAGAFVSGAVWLVCFCLAQVRRESGVLVGSCLAFGLFVRGDMASGAIFSFLPVVVWHPVWFWLFARSCLVSGLVFSFFVRVGSG